MFELTPYRNNRGIGRRGDFFDMIDSFFESPFNMPMMMPNSFRVDLRENDKEYVVDAELAGFEKDEISVDFDDGRLLISATKKDEVKSEQDGSYIYRERSYSSMKRGMYLKNASGEGIKATFKNGVLQVTVPKDKISDKNTKIDIQ